MKPLTAVDLYSGIGGFSLGARAAGVNVIRAFDHDEKHVDIYNKNFGAGKCLVRDLGAISPDDFLKSVGQKKVDIVYGGPPCQGFSQAGKRKLDDVRNNHLIKFTELASLLSPKIIIAENVMGLLTEKFSNHVEEFFAKLKSNGYLYSAVIRVDAQDFGVPQRRKRVLLVGCKKESKLKEFSEQLKRQTTNKKNYIKDAIFDLADKELSNENKQLDGRKFTKYVREINQTFGSTVHFKDRSVSGFQYTNHSKAVVERFGDTPPGQSEPISRYYRLHWEKVSSTLRAGTPSSRGQFMAVRPIHPTLPRVISVREAARIHSFPDNFSFHHTKWYAHMGIGNSVPPLLSKAIFSSISNL